MSDKTFTHKDLAEMLGVSETTVKSYRRKFPGCIPVANNGKPIRFTQDAATVARRIRDYFETGMSVEEVRSRLATEFSWITPETPKNAEQKHDAEGGERAAVSPELSIGVSNMAKGMVSLTQQQKALLTRMQGIEKLLEERGLQGDIPAGGTSGAPLRMESERRGAEIEARLDQLDANSKELALMVQSLAGQLDRFLGRRDKAAEEWNASSAETLSSAARIAEETIARSGEETRAPAHEHASARVIQLRPGLKRPEKTLPESTLTPVTPATAPSEPPRQFFTLPLVVRTEQGNYVSAGGKNRGRFSLNDLKAMLVYGFTPPDHFTLRWETHGQGWWLFLEQERSDNSIHLLLMELPSQRGGNVVEILQVNRCGEALHPVEICSIIDSFGA